MGCGKTLYMDITGSVMKPLHCKYYFKSCGSIKNDALEESDKSYFWGV